MHYHGFTASKIRMLFQEEQKMSDDADQPPEQFTEVRNYELLLVHQDGTRDFRTILARNSVEAIQLALRTSRGEHGGVSALSCKVVA